MSPPVIVCCGVLVVVLVEIVGLGKSVAIPTRACRSYCRLDKSVRILGCES